MRYRLALFAFVIGFFVAAAGGCSRQPAPAPAAGGAASTASTPASAPASSEGGVRNVSGTVLETMNAASYTYVRVKTAEGEIWAATGQFEVAVGDRVTVPLQMAMTDFHSPTLKRDFPSIYFVTEIRREGDARPRMEGEARPQMMAAHAQTAAAAAPAAMSKVEPPQTAMAAPEGGLTIANVWARRKELAGKTVTVRGKVMKFNAEIMGRNWIHIQDGTGDAKDGSNDLTITSQAVTKVGDVITVTGKLAVDKDFGAGYVYRAIVEGATVK